MPWGRSCLCFAVLAHRLRLDLTVRPAMLTHCGFSRLLMRSFFDAYRAWGRGVRIEPCLSTTFLLVIDIDFHYGPAAPYFENEIQ
jgi:hypothetical protein